MLQSWLFSLQSERTTCSLLWLLELWNQMALSQEQWAVRITLLFCAFRGRTFLRGVYEIIHVFFFLLLSFVFQLVGVLIRSGSCWSIKLKAKLNGVALGSNLSPAQDSSSPTTFFFLPQLLLWSEKSVAFPGSVGFLGYFMRKEMIDACGALSIKASCRDHRSKLNQSLGWWWVCIWIFW